MVRMWERLRMMSLESVLGEGKVGCVMSIFEVGFWEIGL